MNTQKQWGKSKLACRLFNQNQRWLRVCEFVVCFLAFEFLQRLLGNQAQFKMIDLRLVFIVLFEVFTVWDMELPEQQPRQYPCFWHMKAGNKVVYPFYEPANWIPFIFYFAAGAVCGYVRMKNRENLEFISEENQLIREKFLFMRDLYQATLQDKKRYKNKFWAVKTALERF